VVVVVAVAVRHLPAAQHLQAQRQKLL